MVKKLFIYIFIYTLLIGCNTQSPLGSECESDCMLGMSAPSLQQDGNGYYHIEWLEGYNQTFSTLGANTGNSGNLYKVYWGSNRGIYYDGEFVSSVNPASYTDENGMAHTVLGIWELMISDTITIYAGYYDECNYEYFDSIKVVVDNEI